MLTSFGSSFRTIYAAELRSARGSVFQMSGDRSFRLLQAPEDPLPGGSENGAARARPAEASEDGSMDSHERGHWVDQQFENFVDCVAQCLPHGKADFLRYYEVPKVAKIYAPPLQLPILVCQTLVTLLALGFLIISLHLYEDVAVVSSTHTFDISFPQRNFDTCHDVDFDCDDVGKSELTRDQNEKANSYCNEAMLHDPLS